MPYGQSKRDCDTRCARVSTHEKWIKVCPTGKERDCDTRYARVSTVTSIALQSSRSWRSYYNRKAVKFVK